MAFRPWENLGLKVIALAIALALWAVVMGEQGSERVVSTRVEFRDVPGDLVLVSRSDGVLLLRLRGPRRLLASVVLDEVAVSLAGRAVREGTLVLRLSPGDILGVPRGVEVVEVTPRSVRLDAEAVVRRGVPVEARLEGAPGPGYVVRRVRLDPPAVEIAGPRTEVGRVRRAYTVPISIGGRIQTFSAPAALEPVGHQVRVLHEMPIQVSVDIGPGRPG